METIKITTKSDFNDLLEFLNEEYPDYHKEYLPGNEYHIHTNDQLFVVNAKFFGVTEQPEKKRPITEILDDMDKVEKIDVNSLENSMKCTEVIKKINELELAPDSNPYTNHLIYGKNETEEVVSVEIVNDQVVMFLNDGTTKSFPNVYWFLTARKVGNCERLEGNLHYKYIHKFDNFEDFNEERARLKYRKKMDIYTIWDNVEASMVYFGITLFKGLRVKDVSRLHFDIESSGLVRDETSFVYVITNTYVSKDERIKKTFRVDHYKDDGAMIEDWCNWCNTMNPSIINGHNIISYDIPYLNYCYGARDGHDRNLPIGRDCSEIKINRKPRKFRVDGGNEWDYNPIKIFGRNVIDGMFLSVLYDFGRAYPSWALKNIVEYEYQKALTKKKKDLTELDKQVIELQKDRQFYDASKIRENWKDLEEREKIVDYCQDDSDDSDFLFRVQVNSFFYYCNYIPMTFQAIICSAAGKQTNLFLIRAYLQEEHGLPKASERVPYGGGISFGTPGVYKNCKKWDISALYPSIILTYNVYDKDKDPKKYYYKMVKHFASVRLVNKKLAKETGERYYSDLEQSQKRIANSSYGLLGTGGLNFNSFINADFVTAKGRSIIKKSIIWASGKPLEYWMPNYDDSRD